MSEAVASRLTYTTSVSAPASRSASRVRRRTGTKAWQGPHQPAPKYSATMSGSRVQRSRTKPAPSGRTRWSAMAWRSAGPAGGGCACPAPQVAASHARSSPRQALARGRRRRRSEVVAGAGIQRAREARSIHVVVVAPGAGFQVLLALVEQVAHAQRQVPMALRIAQVPGVPGVDLPEVVGPVEPRGAVAAPPHPARVLQAHVGVDRRRGGPGELRQA